jgi:hypothetical protein
MTVCPDLIFMSDRRGNWPLEYARREHWGAYVKFLSERHELFEEMSIRARTIDSQYYTVNNRYDSIYSLLDHSYKVHLAVDVSYKGSNTCPFSSLLVSKDVALFESNYRLSWYFSSFVEETVGVSFVWHP